MKKMTKKFFAVAVVIAMLMQLLVVTALADGENGEEPKYEPGKTYVMSKDQWTEAQANVPEGYDWVLMKDSFDTEDGYVCGLEAHTHSEQTKDDCMGWELTCKTEEHTHSSETADDCQGWGLTCTTEEHTHSSETANDCQGWVFTCETEEHAHSEQTENDCQGWVFTCENEEHTHSATCYSNNPSCRKTEHSQHEWYCYVTVGIACPGIHVHNIENGCYELTCTQSVHTHSAYGGECYTQNVCSKEEHTHSAYGGECYTQNVCAKEEHTHSAYGGECYTQNSCTKEEHTHSEYAGACYTQKKCDLIEHTHTDEDCYEHRYTVVLVKKGADTGENGNQWVDITVTVKCANGSPAVNVPVSLTVHDYNPLAQVRDLTMELSTNADGKVTYNISSSYDYVSRLYVDGNEITDARGDRLGLIANSQGYQVTLTDHNMNNVVMSEANCVHGGRSADVCQYCGYEANVVKSDPLGHKPVELEEVPATCSETGLTKGSECEVCGQILVEQEEIEIDPDAHAYEEEITTEPTCEEKGVKTFTCANNEEHIYTEEIDALGHDYDEGVVTTEPTCEAEGVMTFTCANDEDHTKEEPVDALGHDWDEGVVTKEPTTEATGVMTYTCKNDETHTKTEVIPKLVPAPVEPEEEPEDNNSSAPKEEEPSTPVVTPPVVQPQQPEQEVQGAVVEKPVVNETSAVTPETSEPVVTPVPTTPTTNKPDTGDRNQPMLYMMLMMIAAVGMVVVQKTTKQRKYTR